MKVLKFGGSSIGNSARIQNVISIIKGYYISNEQIAIVFSAFQGVTDKLMLSVEHAVNQNLRYELLLKELTKFHLDIINNIIPKSKSGRVKRTVSILFSELIEILNSVYILKELTPKTSDLVVSYGELLSNNIISNCINHKKLKCEFLDSRKLIITDSKFGNAKVDFKETNKNIRTYFKEHKKTQIITGFIASDRNGFTTTLGRGGSDYTASIFGAALNCDEIQIWTDVNGILTADPRKVKEAIPLKSVTYEEAMELSHFGAKVIHPPTMIPALNKKVKIRIKNTFEPSFRGTVILPRENNISFNVKGISSIDNISLLKISGGGMIGVVGIASRLLLSLSRNDISAILITQGSSEHSICLAVLPQYGEAAKRAIENEFRHEIIDGEINKVSIQTELSVIAVVGDDMINTFGVFGKVFNALGQNGINIQAVAQGSSELNMSLVISKIDLDKSLNVLHEALFLSKYKTLNLYLAGPGLVGSEFLRLLNERYTYLKEELGIKFNLAAVANSKKMIIDEVGIELDNWESKLSKSKIKSVSPLFINKIKKLNLPHSVFVDCTSGEKYIPKYFDLLKNNISIVTPNKIANSGNYSTYKRIRDTAKKYGSQFRYSTNVGAALPIINTLKNLIANGDEIIKIEGILSGTLSFIFNSLNEGKGLSEAILLAKKNGYTEPDPRDDLNGLDFARKLLILIRECGYDFELKDIKIEQILSQESLNVESINSFFKSLKKTDQLYKDRIDKLKNQNKKLVYIASFQNKKAKVGFEKITSKHAFYNLSGNDNIVSFTTKNYFDKPLIIRGPGAGARYTATGVFSDVLRTLQN